MYKRQGEPAPTGKPTVLNFCKTPVGAGLPAKMPSLTVGLYTVIENAPNNFKKTTFRPIPVRLLLGTFLKKTNKSNPLGEMSTMIESVDNFLARLKQRDPGQPEFHQAVEEVLRSLWPFLEANPHYLQAGILERMVEPERAVLFRVSWVCLLYTSPSPRD